MSEETLVATASQTVGPFFHFGLTQTAHDRMVDRFSGGAPIRLTIHITDGDGLPVADAMVELGQAGVFGRMPTGEDGCCRFETIRPGSVPDQHPKGQAPHILVCLFARGLLRHLHTRIYLAGDPTLDEDAVLRLVPADRRHTLLAVPEEGSDARWWFDLRLQGADETVFFNV